MRGGQAMTSLGDRAKRGREPWRGFNAERTEVAERMHGGL